MGLIDISYILYVIHNNIHSHSLRKPNASHMPYNFLNAYVIFFCFSYFLFDFLLINQYIEAF